MDGTVIERLIVEWRADYDKYKSDMQQVKATTAQMRSEMNQAKQTVGQTASSVNALGGTFKGQFMSMLGPMALVMAGLRAVKAVADFTGESIKLAMDVVESENLYETSLGNMADSTRIWSEDLAAALGLNSYEIRRTVGLWYTMGESMGLSAENALTMSKNLAQLKYDLMSFYNIGGDQADTIMKGLYSGESEPAKQIGVILTDEMAKKALVTAGIIREGQEIDRTTLLYGRYLTMIEQTSTAQGDMARTIDSPANALRQLDATLNDIKLSLGEAFLPIVQTILPALKALADVIKAQSTMFSEFIQNAVKGPRRAGIEIGGVTKGVTSGSAALDAYGKSADNAFGKAAAGASKLRSSIMGFDQLNVLTENMAGGGGILAPKSTEQPLIAGEEVPKDSDFKRAFDDLTKRTGEKIADAFQLNQAYHTIAQYKFVPDDIYITTKEKLEPIMILFNDMEATTKQWAWGSQTVTGEMATAMTSSVVSAAEAIKVAIDDQTKTTYDTMAEYFRNSSVLTESEEAAALKKLQESGVDRKTVVEGYSKELTSIYAKASSEHRNLTADEQARIAELQELMKSEAISACSKSAEEQQKILDNLRINASDISARQAADIVASSLKARNQTIADAKERCTETITAAEQMRAAGTIDEETYKKIVDDAKKSRDDTIAAAEDTHAAVIEEAKLQAGEHVNLVNWETGEVKNGWFFFWEDFKAFFVGVWNWIVQAGKDIGKFFSDIAQAVVDAWNSIWGVASTTPEDALVAVAGAAVGGALSKKTNSPTGTGTWNPDTASPVKTGSTRALFADGGFPSIGEMFIAREAGPELVGRMGSRSVVANNSQIVEGIESGVYRAVIAAMGNSGDGGDMIFPFYIGNELIAEHVITASQRANVRAGRTVTPLGVV